MRKLLGFLILLVLVTAGGAYYYLTFVFPEREVVANMERTAASIGAEFSYNRIEPGPLGLTGKIITPKFTFPDTANNLDGANRSNVLVLSNITYALDPVWLVRNLPTIHKLRAITHYKSLALNGLNFVESESQFLKAESIAFLDLDYTGYATKLHEDPSFKPKFGFRPEGISSLKELGFISGISLSKVRFQSGGTRFTTDLYEVKGITQDGAEEVNLELMTMSGGGGSLFIGSGKVRNMHLPMSAKSMAASPFSSIEHFELNTIKVGVGAPRQITIDKIYMSETDHVMLEGGIRVPTAAEGGVVALNIPIDLLNGEPTVFQFMIENDMTDLALSLLYEASLNLEAGESKATYTLDYPQLAEISVGIGIDGATESALLAYVDFLKELISLSESAGENTKVLSAEEVLAFIRALTEPILRGSSPEDYELPDLPNLNDDMEKQLSTLLASDFSQISLSRINVAYEDKSLFDKVITYNQSQGMSEADAKTMLSQSLVMAAVAAVGTPVAEEVAMGFYAMTLDPGSFTVDIELAPPVSVGEVMSLSQDKEAMNAFLMTDWNARVQSTLKVYDGEGNEVDTDTLQ